MRKPKEPLEGLAVAFVPSGVPGTFCVVATVPNYPAPIGIVWYAAAHTRRTFMVISSYVDPRWRRRGVRTRLNAAIFEGYSPEVVDRIVTTHGTKKEGGEAFMKATGYRFVPDPFGGSWVLTRQAFLASQKRRAAR